MMQEGKGRVLTEKHKVVITLTDVEFRHCCQKANERNRYRDYKSRKDTWGKGIINNPVLVGMVGESAYAYWLNSILGTLKFGFDSNLYARGDCGKDFELFNRRHQVKCRAKPCDALLVRCAKEDRTPVPLDFDYRIAATLVVPVDPASITATVSLDGWVPVGEVECSPSKPARRGSHLNKEIQNYHFHPMSSLGDLVLSDREYCKLRGAARD